MDVTPYCIQVIPIKDGITTEKNQCIWGVWAESKEIAIKKLREQIFAPISDWFEYIILTETEDDAYDIDALSGILL